MEQVRVMVPPASMGEEGEEVREMVASPYEGDLHVTIISIVKE